MPQHALPPPAGTSWIPAIASRPAAGGTCRHVEAHTATIQWENQATNSSAENTPGVHTWTFDGGASSPLLAVAQRGAGLRSDPALVDPEEALSPRSRARHMLTYLFVASRSGFLGGFTRDEAVEACS